MKKALDDLFSRSSSKKSNNSKHKPTITFKDYHAEWFNTLKNTLLPLLTDSLASVSSTPSPQMPNRLSSHVDAVSQHFVSYYDALDLAATDGDNVAQLLFPEWRNSVEKPFLWLGDFHPYLFTNLLRSFFDDDDDDDDGGGDGDGDDESCIRAGDHDGNLGEIRGLGACNNRYDINGKPWQIATAWKNLPETLLAKVDRIECGMRLMVPALVNRSRDVQIGFIDRVGKTWTECEGMRDGSKEVAVGEAVMAQMDELVSVFTDANRLRKSVLAEILTVTSVYQAALFLEGLAQLLVGFSDPDLGRDFERCKVILNQ